MIKISSKNEFSLQIYDNYEFRGFSIIFLVFSYFS